MEYKKISYHKILVFLAVLTIVALICGCNEGVPPVTEVNGTIDVNSTPSEANVYLDGEDTGQVTPIILTNIAAGDHTIELRKFHYRGWEGVVTVIAEQTAYLNPPLLWAPEETITLQPGAEGKDAHVMSIFPETNNSTAFYLSVGIFTVPFSRSYLQFDLSPVSSEAVIIDANLGLYYDSSYMLTSLPIGLYRVTESWTEGTVTWNNQPAYSSEPSAIQILSNGQQNDFIYWQIIDLVEQWLAGNIDNYGMVLLDTDESSDDGGIEFFSSDWGVASERPKLIIDYFIP